MTDLLVDTQGNTLRQSPMDMVKQFREAYDASKDPALWLKLIEEELDEFDAALQNLIKEFSDIQYVILGAYQVSEEVDGPDLSQDLHDRFQAAAVIAEKVFPLELIQDAFRLVHKSNMSKLGPDGKPVRREDGKILKGPNYQPVDFSFISTKAALA